MIALCREGCLSLDTCCLQQFIELLTLTIGNHTIFVTMENDDRGCVGADILCGTETQVLIGLFREFRSEQHVLRTILAHGHVFATIHSGQVYRTRPVASGIHSTELIGIFTQVALKVECNTAYSSCLHTTSGCCDRGQVTTTGESAGSDKRGVKLVSLCFATNKAYHGTDVVYLGRPWGIDARTVIRTNHSVTCVQQTFDDGA